MTPATTTRLAAGSLGVLLVACLWAWTRASAAAAGADAAGDVLADCRRLAAEIAALRAAAPRAAAETAAEEAVIERVAAAARAAGLPPDAVRDVDPGAARRAGDTAYRTRATGLTLAPLPLPELARFLDALTDGEPGLTVTAVRLAPPRSAVATGGGPETWTADLALTRLIYDPTTGRVPVTTPAFAAPPCPDPGGPPAGCWGSPCWGRSAARRSPCSTAATRAGCRTRRCGPTPGRTRRRRGS